MGIIPCRFTTLDMLRTESYLLFFPFDNSEMYPFENEGPGDTLWELGLDFTVSPGKTGFRGAEEHYRLKGKERFKIWGLKLQGKNVPGNGAPVFKGGKQVGVVTQAMYSPLNDWTVAIARLPVDCANNGTEARGALRHAWPDQGRDGIRCRSTTSTRSAARSRAERIRNSGAPMRRGRPGRGARDGARERHD
jgi:glycine cleavage system aminomethyltransferase T